MTPASVELRYRYNPDVKSLVAMVPAVIPLLLLLIPAMLATLSVVREKDLGSIINFYVTPTTRLEFLLGKQLCYVALGFLNFLLLALLAVTLFDVPMKGDFWTAAAGALLYVGCSTGIGILVSTLTRTQVAALFATCRVHPDPRQQLLRPDRPGFVPGRVRPSGRGRLPDQLLTSRSPAGPSTRRWVSTACTGRSSPC